MLNRTIGLLSLLLFCGCAHQGQQNIDVDAVWTDIVKTMEAQDRIRAVGTVTSVHPDGDFVIIMCPRLPKAEAEAKVYRNGAMVALLKIDPMRRRPYVCADILAGEPRRGDVVKMKGTIL